MTFFFDARAVAAKIQNQQAAPANHAKLAKLDTETAPHLADLAGLATLTGQNAKSEDERNSPTFEPQPPRQQPPNLGPVPDKVGVGGRPVTWTGKVVSLDDWRNLSDWERHGLNGRVWNGKTRQWDRPNE